MDVSDKDVTERCAEACGVIEVSEEVFSAIEGRKIKKGDVYTAAQVAGIMGTKKTSELIPMCHLLNLTGAKIWFEPEEDTHTITVYCRVRTEGKTGEFRF